MRKHMRRSHFGDWLTICACVGSIGFAMWMDNGAPAPKLDSEVEQGPVESTSAATRPVTPDVVAVPPPLPPPARRTRASVPQSEARTTTLAPRAQAGGLRPAPEDDYRADIYRYQEPEIPDGQEQRRAYLRCEQQAMHIPAGERLTYGELARGSVDAALAFCRGHFGG